MDTFDTVSNTTLMKQCANTEAVEESINLPLGMNVGLRLGGKLAMVHVSPFLLILL
jgi:hypothetical protein